MLKVFFILLILKRVTQAQALSLLSISYVSRFISLSWHNCFFFAQKGWPEHELAQEVKLAKQRDCFQSLLYFEPQGIYTKFVKTVVPSFSCFFLGVLQKCPQVHALSFPEVLDGMFANSLEIDLVPCRIEKMRKTTCNEASP